MGCNRQKGFTLVELLVSMGILMFLASMTVVSFGKADQNELLRLGARRLADALGSAQSFAQSGTLAQYSTAKSYGAHTDIVSQQIILFADKNISTGIGAWDGGTSDAAGEMDAPMQKALTFDVGRRGDVRLTAIDIAYAPEPEDACVKDSEGNCHKQAAYVDIAAVPPNARLVFAGIKDAAGIHIEVSNVKNVTFTVTHSKTGKTSSVAVYPLSGRIDVDY